MYRYIYYIVGIVWLLTGCAHPAKEKAGDSYTVTVLRGPSAIAFAQWMAEDVRLDGKRLRVRVVDSPEQMQAEMVKETTDIAVLPMTTAANLYNKGVPYALLGCPIWGTLYLVGHDSITSPVYLFGAGTTPDILTRRYLSPLGTFEYNYTFATAREVMLALQTGKVRTAVLSEPFLSIALCRDSTLRILADLNRPDSTRRSFAQTAIVCRRELLPLREQIDSLLTRSCRYANEQTTAAIRIVEEAHIFAPKMLSEEAVARCRIQYEPAAPIREDILHYLSITKEYEPRAIGGNLPDAGFLSDSL